MKSKTLKIFFILILFSLFLFVTAKSYANAVSNELSENVFRLHIIANSDSAEDQQLKVKVRDSIIEYVENLTKDCKTKKDVISVVNINLDNIKNITKNTVEENGYDYYINIEIGNFYFPTKYYGNVSFPNGYYDALKIEIGEANGQNWWCSLFPALCFTDISTGVIDDVANETLTENLEKEEYNIVTSKDTEYKIKFKILELLN